VVGGRDPSGTRRHNRIYLPDLSGHVEAGQGVLSSTLPAGCSATVLLREMTKSKVSEPEQAD
jgi:tRNA(Glu) U13 pseudouridine synthase TruD